MTARMSTYTTYNKIQTVQSEVVSLPEAYGALLASATYFVMSQTEATSPLIF